MSRPVNLKALRMVLEDRVQIIERTATMLRGRVTGDSGNVYEVCLDPEGYRCECEWGKHHRMHPCSHAEALRLAEIREANREGR